MSVRVVVSPAEGSSEGFLGGLGGWSWRSPRRERGRCQHGPQVDDFLLLAQHGVVPLGQVCFESFLRRLAVSSLFTVLDAMFLGATLQAGRGRLLLVGVSSRVAGRIDVMAVTAHVAVAASACPVVIAAACTSILLRGCSGSSDEPP